MRAKWTRAAAAAAVVITGCGGSDGPSTTTGQFLDSAVSGLRYQASPSGRSGTTNADGQFTCEPGDTVAFSLGGVALGSAACASTLTPVSLAGTASLSDPKVGNRLLFLQILDDDNDPSNGITLSTALRDALVGKTVDFSAAAATFDTALAALLPASVKDADDRPFSDRAIANRRSLAREHFESTQAGSLGQADTSTASDATGGTVQITKHVLQADKSLFVPYGGTNATAKKDFKHGFYPAVGSGLAFKGQAADGTLTFYGITDRGPNGDSPNAPTPADATKTGITKMFPAPDFTPSIGTITVGRKGAVLESLLPLKADAATRITGRPLPVGSVGNSGETPLTDALVYDATKVGFDANGLDSESLVFDAAGKVFWASDEYGPFIVKIDAATGVILKRYAPGTAAGSLPAVLAQRRANRGMEGLAMDAANGRLHGFLQSPIDPLDGAGKSIEVTDSSDLDQDGKNNDKVKVRDFAQFARWIEFDPVSETSKLYAYPLTYPLAGSGQKWDRNRTGSAKLGDLVSLGSGKFIVIEQGADSTGKVRNFLMLVEVPGNVTNIAALGIELEKNSIDGTTLAATAWSAVVPLKKTVLLDLNAAGWIAEKAEGLTLVDARTLAMINDNDFGLRSIVVDAAGKDLSWDPTACTVDAAGSIVNDGNCAPGAVGVRVTRGTEAERPTRLWLFKFSKSLSGYSVP